MTIVFNYIINGREFLTPYLARIWVTSLTSGLTDTLVVLMVESEN